MKVVGSLALLALVLGAAGARSQEPSVAPTALLTVPACQDQFADLPQIAGRLGVAPLEEAQFSAGFAAFRMCDGRRYNVSVLINALLDRIDAAEKATKP